MLWQLNIPAMWVATGNTAKLEEMLGGEMAPAKARELQGTIQVTFGELEREDERIFDAPGVLDYLHHLHERIPHLFYYLVPVPLAGSLEGFIRAQPSFSIDLDRGECRLIELTESVIDALVVHLTSAGRYATAHGDDWRPMVTSMVSALFNQAEMVVNRVSRSLEN